MGGGGGRGEVSPIPSKISQFCFVCCCSSSGISVNLFFHLGWWLWRWWAGIAAVLLPVISWLLFALIYFLRDFSSEQLRQQQQQISAIESKRKRLR